MMTEDAVTTTFSDWTILGLKQNFDPSQRLKCLRSQGGKWKATAIIANSVKTESSTTGKVKGKDEGENRIELGVFATRAGAELKHDLHMLKLEGLTSSGELNQDIILFGPNGPLNPFFP